MRCQSKRYIIKLKAAGELLTKAHYRRLKHIQACAAIMYGVILMLPVHLFHHVLRSMVLRKMYKPILALPTALPTNEEWREVLSSAPFYESLVKCCLNEAPPIRRVFLLNFFNRTPAQSRPDVDGKLLRNLCGKLIVGVGRKGRYMESQNHFTARRIFEYPSNEWCRHVAIPVLIQEEDCCARSGSMCTDYLKNLFRRCHKVLMDQMNGAANLPPVASILQYATQVA